MEEIKSILLNLDGFEDLNEESINLLAQKGIIKKYEKEEVLFFDKERVNYCYIIASGKVKVSKLTANGKEKIIHILQKGDIINEINLDGRPSSVTAEIIKGGKIIAVKTSSLLKIMEQDFDLTLHILNSVNLKLRQTYRQVRNLGLKQTGPRIAARLWKLARDYGKEVNKGIIIDLNLTQRELAQMIGTSRETVSRFLNELNRNDIIEIDNSKITILDLKGVEKLTY